MLTVTSSHRLYRGAILPDGRTIARVRYVHAQTAGQPIVTTALVTTADGATVPVALERI